MDECVALREHPCIERIVVKLREAEVGSPQLRQGWLPKQLGSVTDSSTEACTIGRVFQQPEVHNGILPGISRDDVESATRARCEQSHHQPAAGRVLLEDVKRPDAE